jgi:4-oxalocrotonate tautomerase
LGRHGRRANAKISTRARRALGGLQGDPLNFPTPPAQADGAKAFAPSQRLDHTGPTRPTPAQQTETTMPFVRIDLKRGKSAEYRKTLGEIVYKAMLDVINVPQNDKFQIITEHDRGDLNYAESYLGNSYSDDLIFIQITLNAGRSVEMKKALYKRIVDDFQNQLQGRPDDIFISLVEVAKENWSFGNGIAQYAS